MPRLSRIPLLLTLARSSALGAAERRVRLVVLRPGDPPARSRDGAARGRSRGAHARGVTQFSVSADLLRRARTAANATPRARLASLSRSAWAINVRWMGSVASSGEISNRRDPGRGLADDAPESKGQDEVCRSLRNHAHRATVGLFMDVGGREMAPRSTIRVRLRDVGAVVTADPPGDVRCADEWTDAAMAQFVGRRHVFGLPRRIRVCPGAGAARCPRPVPRPRWHE